MNFEKLRDMEAFTDEMFNNIIAFQEKEHAAWNAELPFQERLRNLPLHYLIFSNADRDPAVCGPTVAHYYPLRREMQTVATYARQVAEQPVVCDLHARNGFIGSLLAQEGLKVVGVQNPDEKPNQIGEFYDSERYELRQPADLDFPFDVAFSSWMPAGTDITPDLVRHRPKLVVYVFTRHLDEVSGQPQTGTATAFGDQLPQSYKLIDEWDVTRRENLLREVWPDLTGNIEETRHVRIYADEGYHHIATDATLPTAAPYDWERELEMAELAYEAKQRLRAQGYPV